MLTRRSNVLVSKSGCTSIRRPPGSTTASPQLGSRCFGDFLAANSTGTKRLVEEIGLPLLSNAVSFQCSEAQTSTLTKLAPPHAAAHKLGHQLLNFRTGTSLGL
jgi:hypothetical protein